MWIKTVVYNVLIYESLITNIDEVNFNTMDNYIVVKNINLKMEAKK